MDAFSWRRNHNTFMPVNLASVEAHVSAEHVSERFDTTAVPIQRYATLFKHLVNRNRGVFDSKPLFASADTHAAYQLRYHVAWNTYRRREYFVSSQAQAVLKAALQRATDQHELHLLDEQIEASFIRTLVSVRPDQSPSRVTQLLKGALASVLRQQLGLRGVWSRGLFVRSVGHNNNDIVRDYVSQQYTHHQAWPGDRPELAALARYHSPEDPSVLRTSTHAIFEYNLHVVLVTEYRCEILDPEVAAGLLQRWLEVSASRGWLLWDVEIVWNHAHLFLGANLPDAAGDVALSLMNHGASFLESRYAASWRDRPVSRIWTPGYYVGTVGSATTAQVRSYLAAQKRQSGPDRT